MGEERKVWDFKEPEYYVNGDLCSDTNYDMKISFNKNWYIATETSQPIAVDLKNKQFSVYSISDAHVGTWKITFEYRIANEPLASNYRLNDAN